MTVAALVGRTLAELGVGRAFGVVGSGNFVVTNALRDAGVPFVATRHEGGAATMADAYGRMSERVTAVTVHQGCGLTNALTGIGEAAKSRTPLIVVAADTAGSAVRSNFRIDQDAAAAAVGAVAERVHSAASAHADTVRAYRTAVQERRTVVLNLPLDVAAQPAPPGEPMAGGGSVATSGSAGGPPLHREVRPDPASVAELARLLESARRPVFVAGRGARHAGAELRALAERCGALLATSAVATGLFTGDAWSVGIAGGFASPVAAELITDADVVVGWGCALNMWTTRHGALVGPHATVVQVDLEPSALGAHHRVDQPVLGDVAATARDVAAALGERPGEGYRTDDVRERIAAGARWRDVGFEDASTADRIDPRVLSACLDDLLPAERIVAVDSGNFMGYPSAYLAVPDQYGFCFTQGFQSVGLGLSTAVGAALARPDRVPVAALGDGGFLMGVAEMETAVRLGLGLVVVIYDDAAYGAEVHHFDTASDAHLDVVRFPDRDLAAIGAGFGCDGLVVRRRADLDGLTRWLAGRRDRPLVIDAKVTADEPSWWLAEAFGH